MSITSCARMWGNVRAIFTKNIQIRIIKFHSNFMKIIDLSLWEIVRAFLQIFLTTCERMWENKLTIFSLQIVRECESISYKFSIQICARMWEIFKKKIIKIIHKNHKVYRSIFPIFSKKSDKKTYHDTMHIFSTFSYKLWKNIQEKSLQSVREMWENFYTNFLQICARICAWMWEIFRQK